MTLTQKRLLITGGVVVLIAAVTIFLIATRRENKPVATQPIQGGEELLPAPEAPRMDEVVTSGKSGPALRKISENTVFDFWVSYDGRDIYYLGNDGRIFAGKNGPDLEVSTEKLQALNRIEPSPSSTKILAAFGDPRRPQWAVFGASDRFWSPLPGNIIEATWGKNDNQIFAFGTDDAIREIDLSKSPFGEKTVMKNINPKDIRLLYYPDNKLFLLEKPSGIYESRIFQIDLKTLSINLMFAAQKGGALAFSEDRNWIFKYSSRDGVSLLTKALSLLVPEEADADVSVSFPTLPSKCNSWQTILFCFVPLKPADGTLFPDDYFAGRFYSIDDLYKVDLETGFGDLIIRRGENPLGIVDAKNVKVRDNKIYFMDRYDNALYELALTNDK